MEYNIEIKGRDFFQFKSIMKRYFKVECDQVFQVVKDKQMYKIVAENYPSIRLDIYNKVNKKVISKIKKRLSYYKLLPRKLKYSTLIDIVETPDKIFKISKWIDGAKIGDVWYNKKIFKMVGEIIAQINMVNDPVTGNFLMFTKFNKDHAIWSNRGDIYLIGDNIRPTKNVDQNICQLLTTVLQKPEKIKYFLIGYKKIRNDDRITDIIYKK